MSVFIKGMTLPKDGIVTIGISSNGSVYRVDKRKITAERYMEEWPAVDVPAPHGRLIDANKLESDIAKYHVSDGAFQHWIQVQNTVIEAEGE